MTSCRLHTGTLSLEALKSRISIRVEFASSDRDLIGIADVVDRRYLPALTVRVPGGIVPAA